MSKASVKREREEECKARLLEMIQPGDTVYTILRHVSRSGMYRAIALYIIKDGRPIWVSRYAGDLLGVWNERYEACGAGGCGMDMGFHLVYELSHRLFGKGWGCIGEGCPSNDHSNGDRDYTPHGHRGPRYIPGDKDALRHWHNDGGYALRQSWM
jgi:hypothetical protein